MCIHLLLANIYSAVVFTRRESYKETGRATERRGREGEGGESGGRERGREGETGGMEKDRYGKGNIEMER